MKVKNKKERIMEVNWSKGGMTSFPDVKIKSMLLDEERNMLTFVYGKAEDKHLVASINLNNVNFFEIITKAVPVLEE